MMRKISIDFAQPSFTRMLLRQRSVAWIGSCIGLLFCIAGAFSMLGISKKQETLRSDIQRIESRLSRTAAAKPSALKSTITVQQAKSINGAIVQLNLPWQDLLDSLEAATPPSIALLTLEPDGKKHLLKVSAEAKTSNDMLSYIEEMKQQVLFNAVILTKHEVNVQDPNNPIRFQFEAQWVESE